MPPNQNPAPGGQQDLTNIEKMLGDLTSTVETKFSEFDNKITDLSTENADLRKYIEDGGANPPAPNTPPPAQNQPGWQPKSWDDFPALVEEKTKEIVQSTFQEAAAKNQQMSDEQRRAQQQIDTEIDNQLDKLTKEGVLPKVENSRDPNDAGNIARKELLALSVALETPNIERVAHDVLIPAHTDGRKFDVSSGQWLKADPPLAGRFAPVGSSSARTNSGPSGPSYDVVHKARNMDDLIAYADQHGYGPAPQQQ